MCKFWDKEMHKLTKHEESITSPLLKLDGKEEEKHSLWLIYCVWLYWSAFEKKCSDKYIECKDLMSLFRSIFLRVTIHEASNRVAVEIEYCILPLCYGRFSDDSYSMPAFPVLVEAFYLETPKLFSLSLYSDQDRRTTFRQPASLGLTVCFNDFFSVSTSSYFWSVIFFLLNWMYNTPTGKEKAVLGGERGRE
jgi:hypothetical protein